MPYRSGKLAAIVVLLLGLAACAPPRTTVNVIGDKFSKEVTLVGIPLYDPDNGHLLWMLRSFVNPQTHAASHQIYIEWTYAGPSSGRYWAADDTAQDLPVSMLFKESCPFNKCDRTDTIGIGLNEATLRARVATGFQVKLSAQDGTAAILTINSQMITAQLQAEDQVLRAGSVGAAVATVNPQVIQEAKEGASQLDRFFNARYHVTVAAASMCGRRLQPSSGITMLTLSALQPATRGPMLAAYPWLGDELSVVTVTKGSPAEQAGLQPGDQIVTINGKAPTKGAAGPVSAAKLIQASGSKPWHVAIRRNNASHEMTVTPTEACDIGFDLGKERVADISADGQLGAGLNPFIKSEDDEAALMAFALALRTHPDSDLNLDKMSLIIATRAGYKIAGVPELWQRLAQGHAQLTVAHPVTEERLMAMQSEIDTLRPETAQQGK